MRVTRNLEMEVKCSNSPSIRIQFQVSAILLARVDLPTPCHKEKKKKESYILCVVACRESKEIAKVPVSQV